MTTLAEKIAAAQARIKREEEKIAEMKRKESEGPKRQQHRSPEVIAQIVSLETELRKQYGCGYAGLADITRKAKKAAPLGPEIAALEPEPREHHGDGDEPLPVVGDDGQAALAAWEAEEPPVVAEDPAAEEPAVSVPPAEDEPW